MRITQSHCDYAFAVARNARYEGLTKEQLFDLLNAAFTVLEQNDKRVEEMDRAAREVSELPVKNPDR